MDQTKGLGSVPQVGGGLSQVILVAARSVVKQFFKEKEYTYYMLVLFRFLLTCYLPSIVCLIALICHSRGGSCHVVPHTIASAEGKDKGSLEGDHPTASAVSGAVSKVPNPSISSAAGIEIDGTIVEVWGSTGEGESRGFIPGGVAVRGLTLVGGGVGD